MRILLLCFLFLPLHAKEVYCEKGRTQIDLRNPVTSKRSVYCVLKKDGQFIKDGPKITFDILGKVESEKFYINGVEAPFPKKEALEFEILILNSTNISDTIMPVAFTRDHNKIAVTTTKGKIRIYDLNSPNKLTYLNFPTIKNDKGLKVTPQTIAWSKGGSLLAAGFIKGQMVIINTLKNIPHSTFDVEGKIYQTTTFLKFTDKGLLINRHGDLHLYETENWQRLWMTEGNDKRVYIDENRKLLITMDRFKSKILFKSLKNAETLESYHLSTTLKRKFFFNSISHDGKLVSSVEEDILLSQKEKKKVVFATLKDVQRNKGIIADKFVDAGTVTTKISPDKKRYYVIASPTDENYDSELKIYDIKSRKLILEKLIPLKKLGEFWISDNSRYFTFVTKNTNLRVIDLKEL